MWDLTSDILSNTSTFVATVYKTATTKGNELKDEYCEVNCTSDSGITDGEKQRKGQKDNSPLF